MPSPIARRIVDAHQHVFWHGRDDRGLIDDMDAHGIEYAWLLSWDVAPWEDAPSYHRALNPLHRRADGTHVGIPLSDLVLARDRYRERFLLGYCPHPLIGNAPDLLRAAVGIHGVRICGEWKFRIAFDDPRSLELFRVAGELGLPVVLHLDVPYLPNAEGQRVYQPLWYGGTVENLERALVACPKTVFIGHAPGFWREISGDAQSDGDIYPRGPVASGGKIERLLEAYPNLWADLSADSALYALQRDRKVTVRLLEKFADRILFARDYYGQDLHDFLLTLELTESTRSKIFHENAERIVPRKP